MVFGLLKNPSKYRRERERERESKLDGEKNPEIHLEKDNKSLKRKVI